MAHPNLMDMALFAVALSLNACTDAATELGPPTPRTDLEPGVDEPANAHGETPELMAVGRFEACSAVAVDVGGDADAPAYVLTAGHCTGTEYYDANRVFVDLPPHDGAHFSGNVFYDTYEAPLDFPVARIEYSTLHLHDIAVVRLEATNAELKARGIKAVQLADSAPMEGEPITIAGMPNNGALLRSRCDNGASTYLAEGEFIFRETSNRCGAIAPGSSGSPVFNDRQQLLGVISTGSGQGHPCALDNPCDLSQNEPANPTSQISYYSETAGLAACFPSGRFKLDVEACPLTMAPVFQARRGVARYTQATAEAPPSWDVLIADETLPYYRVKSGSAAITRCDEEQGYGTPQSVVAHPIIDELVAAQHRLSLLCLWGGRRKDSFTKLDAAFALLTEVDNTAPEPPDRQALVNLGRTGVDVWLPHRPPDWNDYYFRLQRPGDSDCARSSDDTETGDKTTSIHVEYADPKRELCLTVVDLAGNESAPSRVPVSTTN